MSKETGMQAELGVDEVKDLLEIYKNIIVAEGVDLSTGWMYEKIQANDSDRVQGLEGVCEGMRKVAENNSERFDLEKEVFEMEQLSTDLLDYVRMWKNAVPLPFRSSDGAEHLFSPPLNACTFSNRTSNHMQITGYDMEPFFRLLFFVLDMFCFIEYGIDDALIFSRLMIHICGKITSTHVDPHGDESLLNRMAVTVDESHTGSFLEFLGFKKSSDPLKLSICKHGSNVFNFAHRREAHKHQNAVVYTFLFNAKEEVTVFMLKEAMQFALFFLSSYHK